MRSLAVLPLADHSAQPTYYFTDGMTEALTTQLAKLGSLRVISSTSVSRFKGAQRRLQEAEARVELVRRWQQTLPQAILEYQGPARQLAGFLDTDLKKALVVLDNKISALEAYAAVALPSEPTGEAKAASEQSASASPDSSSPVEGGGA